MDIISCTLNTQYGLIEVFGLLNTSVQNVLFVDILEGHADLYKPVHDNLERKTRIKYNKTRDLQNIF